MPTVLHNTLTTTDLHEPKGVSAATIGDMYVADGAGSGDWGGSNYASIYSTHADSIAVSTIGATAKKLDGFSHDGPANVAVPAFASHQITATTKGDYWVDVSIAFGTVASGDSGTYAFHVRVNDVESVVGFHRSMSGTSDLGSAGCSGILSLAAADVITVYVSSDEAGNTDDINIYNVTMNTVLMRAT